MIDPGDQRSSGCVTVRGQVDGRTGRTVALVEQDDGSWLIEGIGERPVHLTAKVMRIVAERVLHNAR